MTTSDVCFVDGLDAFGAVIDQVGADEWDRPSACAGWTNLDVFGHLTNSIRMGTSLLRGEQPEFREAERPADLVDGDPAATWADLATEARAAVAGADLDLVMETPMGPRSVRDRLAFPAIDLWVHAWDIGHGLGLDVVVPEEVAAFSRAYIDPFPVEMVRGEGGAFGPEVTPPADATPTEAFIAWTGRDPR